MTKLFAFLENHRAKVLLVAGGISATGFAPLNWWPLTLLCLALLMHWVARACSGKRAFLLGWAFGVGHFTIGNNWIATAFTYQANMPVWLGWCAVPLLALYLAVYPGVAAWGAWWLKNSPPPFRGGARGGVSQPLRNTDKPHPNPSPKGEGLNLPFILFFAGCWIITEWLRACVFTGFSWNPLSALWVDTLWSGMWLPIVGTYGMSGLLLFYTGLLAAAVPWFKYNIAAGNFQRSGSWVVIGFVALFIAPVLAVSFVPDSLIPQKSADYAKADVALTIVQPNISQIDKYAPGYDAINFRRLAENSLSRDTKPRLILWPEAAIPWRLEDGYPYRFYQFQPGESAEGARTMLTRLMNPGDLLLTGVDRLEFDKDRQLVGARNSMTAMDASGKILGNYDKAHLVPYGEYLALRWLLEPLGAARLVPGDLDFWPGPGPRTLDLPFDGRRVKVGMQICYEIIFSGQVVDQTHRPDFIFNPSNDAWFGGWGSPQFLAQARLRAIEEGLPVVRATPTGISAVIDADGRVLKSLPQGIAGRIDAQLPRPKEPTLFARYGNALPMAFAALLIAFGLMPLARRRTSR
jgi:apolipoprotein N-acyltransferase